MKNFKRYMFLFIYVNKDAKITERHKSLLTTLIKSITRTKYSRWKYIEYNLFRYSEKDYIHFGFQYIDKNEKNFYNV